MMSNQHAAVIIKKKRNEDHEAHSSAWKLAFADLMVCLTCVFLVLWVLEVANKDDRQDIINSLKTGEAPDESSNALFESPDSLSPIELLSFNKDHKTDTKATKNTSLIQGEYNTQEELEVLKTQVNEYIKEIEAEKNIFIQVVPDGLRIVLTDSPDKKMFKLGDSHLTPFYKKMLLKFSAIFNKIENGISISGHTDALQFKGGSKSNWALSTQRANEARETMEVGGLHTDNIAQVLGLANTKPLDKTNLAGSVNRRIEVIVLSRDAKDKLNDMPSMSDEQLKLDIDSTNG